MIASLSTGEVHVWNIAIAADTEMAAETVILVADELQRAQRFQAPSARRQFVAGRHWLRRILGHYTGILPQLLPLRLFSYGRPSLAGDHDLDFNVSHSHDRLLIAVGRAVRVGIDLEQQRLLVDADAIVDRHFSPPERALYYLEAESRRLAWFFRVWVRKEAVLKALGTGLSERLSALDVASREGLGLSLPDWSAPGHHLTDLDVAPGYAAALMVLGKLHTLRVRDDMQAIVEPD